MEQNGEYIGWTAEVLGDARIRIRLSQRVEALADFSGETLTLFKDGERVDRRPLPAGHPARRYVEILEGFARQARQLEEDSAGWMENSSRAW